MTETKWTPGPWRLEAGTGPHTGTWVITAEGMRSNTPLARLSDFDDAAAHDARLIAAAPELYEAGLEALPVIDAYLIRFPHSKYAKRVREMLSDAMAKARGEQP